MERKKPYKPQHGVRTALPDSDLAWNFAEKLDVTAEAFRKVASQALLRKMGETLRHLDDAIESMYAVAKDLQ